MALQALIDKQDTFEIVRDQIASILVAEVANQVALAIAATKDPLLWDMQIFLERSNPWEQWLNLDGVTDKRPIVNIWFDSLSNDKAASDPIDQQKADGSYNIDIYGIGVATDDGAGFAPADREAAFEAHRAVRLVRNILMAAENTYLELRGTVWGRWVDSITSFQPELNGRQAQRIVGARIKFQVSFNEFSPQYTGVTLNTLTATVKRAENDEIVLVTEYDYT